MSATFLLSTILALAISPAQAQNFTINNGQTVTIPGSQPSPWVVGGNLYNRGDLLINGGGNVSVGNGLYVGATGMQSLLKVSDFGSELHVTGILQAQNGVIRIANDGWATSAAGTLDATNTSSALAEVSGGGRWDIGGILTVGDYGKGILQITNGGVVNAAQSHIGGPVNPLGTGIAGTIEVSDVGSELNLTSFLNVGYYHDGILRVTNGGVVRSVGGTVGWSPLLASGLPAEEGWAEVSGEGSLWDNTGTLTVGGFGIGTLYITDGGVVTSAGVMMGRSSPGGASVPGGDGYVEVSGVNSQGNHSLWNNGTSTMTLGTGGFATVLIKDGGEVITGDVNVSANFSRSAGSSAILVYGAGSRLNSSGVIDLGPIMENGILEVGDGGVAISAGGMIRARSSAWIHDPGSRWDISGTIEVSSYNAGRAVLWVENGAVVTSAGGIIGGGLSPLNPPQGEVQVTGANSRWDDSSGIIIGQWGEGVLLIGSGGTVTTPAVDVGLETSSGGMLIIGGWNNNWNPETPGTLTTSSITFGLGFEPLIVFNHTSSNYLFDATINGGNDNAAGSGTGLVGSGIVWAYSGRTILNADHGDFTGELRAGSPGILQVNGDLSGGTAVVYYGGRLEGNGIVGSTVSGGIIAPGASIGVLTIAGDYTGNNGILHIEAVLDGDNSPADRLVITGDVFGSTTVVVTNLGGSGAQTVNGIKIIEVGGISPGNAFMLKGDYVTESGQQAAIGGAYAYTLQHNSPANPSDGSWYLTSELTFIDPETGEVERGPRYQPGIPLYEQYPQVLAALNTVPTLQQRVGNRGWVNNNVVAAAPGNTPGNYGMWGRIEGTRTASDPARSTIHAHRDTDLWKLQTGFDFGLHQGADGSQLIGGVNVSHGTALAEIASPYGRGKIDTTGTGIGATLTWYGSHGFYVDGQAQVTWFDTDITSTTEGRKLIKGNNGHGYVLSAETGNRYQLGNGFSVTPQVQLVYSRVDFDSFSDPFDAHVSLNDGDSLRGRFGVSLDHEAGWVASDGSRSRSHIYGIANLYNEFLDGAKVNVSGVRFSTRDERVWAGIGIGGTYEWANGAYAFYGNANLAGSVEHMSDNYAFGGTIGFRARW